jgi:hypothetical protein
MRGRPVTHPPPPGDPGHGPSSLADPEHFGNPERQTVHETKMLAKQL